MAKCYLRKRVRQPDGRPRQRGAARSGGWPARGVAIVRALMYSQGFFHFVAVTAANG